MRELKELTTEFPKTFHEYMSDFEIKQKLYDLNTSCETYYDEEIEEGKSEGIEVDGHMTVSLPYPYIGRRIKVFTRHSLEHWNEEDGIYTDESYEAIGWELEW